MNSTTYRKQRLFGATAGLAGLLAFAIHMPANGADITFAFTADIHSAFDGNDDEPGLAWSLLRYPTDASRNAYYWLGQHETWTSPPHDGCQVPGSSQLGGVMDLCNQIQLVRKLNALPRNTWPTAASSGQPIAPPRGLLIGGDLTLCGKGHDGSPCGDKTLPAYHGVDGAQLGAFAALFDRDVRNSYTGTFEGRSFLKGLNFAYELPLHYGIYPGLGNHDTSDSSVYDYLMNWGVTPIMRTATVR